VCCPQCSVTVVRVHSCRCRAPATKKPVWLDASHRTRQFRLGRPEKLIDAQIKKLMSVTCDVIRDQLHKIFPYMLCQLLNRKHTQRKYTLTILRGGLWVLVGAQPDVHASFGQWNWSNGDRMKAITTHFLNQESRILLLNKTKIFSQRHEYKVFDCIRWTELFNYVSFLNNSAFYTNYSANRKWGDKADAI